MEKVLIDSDICLDSITARYPYSVNADKLLQAVEDGILTGVVSAESFSNIYYVLRKLSTHQEAIGLLKHLRKIFQIGTVTPEIIEKALSSGWRDFEDAIQHFCAAGEKCDAIVTRNRSDYKKSSLPVYTPRECLDKL
ncbi:PIN domain nuclease [soil metagenome]